MKSLLCQISLIYATWIEFVKKIMPTGEIHYWMKLVRSTYLHVDHMMLIKEEQNMYMFVDSMVQLVIYSKSVHE